MNFCNPASFPSLWFKIDSAWYEMPAESYVGTYTSFGITVCAVKIRPKPKASGFGILGITFLENFA